MNIIVVGASHAGISFADAMRRNGFAGGLTLIDSQPGLPLERPPLSKAFLQSEDSDNDARFALRDAGWFDANNVTLIDGVTVAGIDAPAHSITLDDGRALSYDKLVLATGAAPRQLAAHLDGVFVLRDPDDARRLRAGLSDAQSAIIIGGGYIGLEVAASLIKLGKKVTVIEAADRVLARVASPLISSHFADLHSSSGAVLHVGSAVEDIISDDGKFTGVVMADGSHLAADMLVVGIGVLPRTEVARLAGAEIGNGIQVNASMQTNAKDIYAIGDVALIADDLRDDLAGGLGGRIESVHNASDSAERAAAAINGHAPPTPQAPWFWSEQYHARLQSAGLVPVPGDKVRYVRRPGKREPGFSVWSFEGDALKAIEAVGDPAGYMLGKKCLERGLSPDPDQLGDSAFDLKGFAAG